MLSNHLNWVFLFFTESLPSVPVRVFLVVSSFPHLNLFKTCCKVQKKRISTKISKVDEIQRGIFCLCTVFISNESQKGGRNDFILFFNVKNVLTLNVCPVRCRTTARSSRRPGTLVLHYAATSTPSGL